MSEIIISSGVTSTGLVAESGDIIIIEDGGTLVSGTIRDGGTLNATYGAVAADLTAEAGATVELTGTAKTSGLMLTGANTNIAEGTFHYMGSAVTGEVTNGTLSNLSGAYRFCVGAGITVSDPAVGGEATVKDRVYALETAVVSGGSITTNGNVGMQGESYGNEVTVGGEGITAATYNLFDNATADNTTVNAGGTFRLNDAGNTANRTVVNSGGTVRFEAGAGADVVVNSYGVLSVGSGVTLNGVTQSGGNIYIYDGAVVNGLNAYALTAAEVPCFYLSGGTAIGGSAAGNDDGEADGQVVGTGVLSNYVLTTSQTAFAKNNKTWVWIGGNTMVGGGLAKDVTVNNRARLQVQGVGASAVNVNVVSGGSLWIFNSARVTDVLVSGLLGTVSAQIMAGYNDNTYGKGVVVRRATVDSGGLFEVSRGATVEDVTVLSTGRMNVRSGGYVSNATVSANGRLDVSAGASLDVATVKDGGFLVAWPGTIRDVQVSGTSGATKARLSALLGGTVENVDVYNGGLVEVGRDGAASANDVRVRSGGQFRIMKGTATNAAVYSSGYMYVESGVTVNGVTQSGGTMWISGGAVVNDMNVHVLAAGEDAWFHLNGTVTGGSAAGTDAGATVYGNVVGDGVLSNYVLTTDPVASTYNNKTWIYIGGNAMTGGGLAKDVTVKNRARLQVQGVGASAVNTDVVSGGSMWIYNTAVVTDTLVSGAMVTGRKAQVEAGYNDNTYGKNITVRRITVDEDGLFNVSKGATAYDAVVRNGGTMTVFTGGVVSGANVYDGGLVNVSSGGVLNLSGTDDARNVKVLTSGSLLVSTGAVARDVVASGTVAGNGNSPFWSIDVKGGEIDGGSAIGYNNVTYAVFLRAIDGGELNNFTITADNATGDARVWAMVGFNNCVAGSGADLTVESRCRLDARNGGVVSGATVRNGGIAVAWGGKITDAVVGGAGAGASARLSATNMGTSIGIIERAAISAGGYLEATGSSWVDTADIHSGGSMKFGNDNASGADITVHSGGSLWTYTNGAINNLTVSAGGTWNCEWNYYATLITGTATFDLTGAAGLATAMAERHFNGLAATRIVKASEIVGNYSYQLLASGGHQVNSFTLEIGGGNDYGMRNGAAAVIDPLTKMSYALVSSGYVEGSNTIYDLKLVTTVDSSRQIATVDTAAALATSGSTLNGSDREAKWTQNTTVASSIYLADGMTAGNAWLEIDGATVGSALYGAAAGQNFAGVVNLKLTSGSIRNLAGGAASGGSVKAVNFEMAGGELAGNTYAGGMGTVAGAVKTTVAGGELAAGKNLYGGALWNKLSNATSVGEVNLTVKAGTIDGNVYGASAVKTGTISTTAATDARHTVGDVTLTLAGGTAANAEFCAFAGGYATGTDSAKLASVYDVGDVTLTLTGGSWGDATDVRGGRGVFGGVMASGVKATAGNVSITVEAGTVANVFGGGWAQKGGISAVENVEITVTGGTVANIFGSGRRSVQGESTTVVENVSITLAGGNVTGNVFARGITDGDAVTGDVSVTVTGSVNYGCNFYGFSRNTGEEDTAVLSFSDYIGTISGEVGGFKEITLAGDTAMAFSNGAAISNTAWTFDVAERTTSATAFASCETATFSGATVALNIGEDQTLTGAWSIFDGGDGTTYGEFDVLVNGTSILSDALALDEQIADGDYAGWGFTVEDTVLKFKNLA